MSSKGLNKAMIIGRLGQDPEIRYSASGAAVANLSVVTSESWKDKSGEMTETPEWHRIVIFGKLAEIAGKYLSKGQQAYFEGRIQTRKWQDKDGNDRYSTEIVANEMQFLGNKQDSPSRPATGNTKTPKDYPENTPAGDGFDEIPF